MTAVSPVRAETTRPPAAPTPRPVPGLAASRRLDRLVLLVVGALGLTRLTFPFTGDQAFFMVGARAMSRGAVLYRDFSDVKQPGIYVFYLVAGALGGFNEVAVHLLELVMLLAFSWMLQRAGRRLFAATWVASLLPLFVVGLYYASARPWELTQLEAWVGIPVFASVWCALRAVDAMGPGRRALLFGSGAAAGIAAILKLVCMALAVPAWLVAVVLIVRGRPRSRAGGPARFGAASLAWVGAGVAVPVAAVAAYFTIHGLWHEVLWTYFTYTPKATSVAGRPLSRLVDAITRHAAVWAPVLILAAVGLVATVRRGWDRWRIALAGWIAVGVPVWLLQLWWPYQLQMFLVPLGFFAAYGTEQLVHSWHERSPWRSRVIVAVLVLSALPLAVSAGRWTLTSARHGFGITASQRAAIQDADETQYRTGSELARFVAKNDPGNGPVYVLGNPIDLYRSGRAQPIATGGWGAEEYDATLWHRIATGLQRSTPGVLVVDDFSGRKVDERSPETRAVITSLYCPAQRVASETWYLLRRHARCPATVRPNV